MIKRKGLIDCQKKTTIRHVWILKLTQLKVYILFITNLNHVKTLYIRGKLDFKDDRWNPLFVKNSVQLAQTVSTSNPAFWEDPEFRGISNFAFWLIFYMSSLLFAYFGVFSNIKSVLVCIKPVGLYALLKCWLTAWSSQQSTMLQAVKR